MGGGGGRIGEEEAQDMAFVGLDAADKLEGGQGPDEELTVVCAGKNVRVGDGESENGAVMLELLDADGGV